ncbi:LAME_0D10946g1_1 [Lachancea meyersii CBS 8951]|uniref:Phosphoacetylglucosamine mutase n=1 Tax=Lachancea meyersii CBS 8951 TaxID=1266667 RepID=A0A1G4JC72_9SACH|nr:LAME_0D10946g1_1 [Lachancea meyersii CBS 8951]
MLETEALKSLYEKHCKHGFQYIYGTAGFRYKADVLDTVMFTTGVLAGLRSLYLNGQTVGVMVTASHNPPEDNGVKIVEPRGEMLEQSWEKYATELANCASQSYSSFETKLQELVVTLKVDTKKSGGIVVARDSRESGPHLVSAFKAGAQVLPTVKIIDYGILTTPQLHFLTSKTNELPEGAEIGEQLYYQELLSAWDQVTDLCGIKSLPFHLQIDAANGIGGPKVMEMLSQSDFFSGAYEVVNADWQTYAALNHLCGADFVKTNQKLPHGISSSGNQAANQISCSFDGDADRIVFYYCDAMGHFRLLDGDKMATLFAKFFQDLLHQAGLQDAIEMVAVQTAYANGSSTHHLEKVLGATVKCTSTGVKHLHHEAVKSDIGIYFEANGHGTVIFSTKFVDTVNQRLAASTQDISKSHKALQLLKLFTKLINQTVGDAISDMLAVLAVLSILNWTPQKWDQEYTDLPNRLLKVSVPDRTLFKTTNAERQLVSPAGLQQKIDVLVSKFDKARSFVRASGTEDAVRVYAEAASRAQADSLASMVGTIVENS